MALPFFGGAKKNLLEQVSTSTWKDMTERDALLKQLKDSAPLPKEVLPLLWHSDMAVRAVSAEIIVSKPDVPILMALVEQWADKPTNVKGWVGQRVFGRVPAEILQKVANDLIGDKNPVRIRLGWDLALTLQGEVGLKFVERAVKEAPLALRAPALNRLLGSRDPNTLLDLLLELSHDPDSKIANLSQEALTRTKDPRVLILMLESFNSTDAAIQQRATAYLREQAKADPLAIRKKMLDLLGAGEDALRRSAVDLLFETGPTNEVLVEILAFSQDLVGWLRDRILQTLRGVGDSILESSIQLLHHSDEAIRTSALILAENFHDARLVAPVGQLLKDPDWWLRINACDTLGRLKQEAGVPYLVEALEDPDTRWAAIDGLAQIASPTAIKPLVGLLRDPKQEVRMEVIRAFSHFSDPRLLAVLQQVKEKDPSSEVRTRAAEVLRDMGERLHQGVSNVEQGTSSVAARTLTRPLDRLLATIREQGASDMHLSVEEPPWVRMGGEVVRMDKVPALSGEQTKAAIFGILEERQRKVLEEEGEIDFCYAIPEVGRYRANAYRQRKGYCCSFRVIPNIPPTFADLRLPGRLTELLDYHQGLIVVSGPAGSGKSTTLAAIVNLINERKADHVITLEDPIEFVHPVKTALINQREVGRHTDSFARALRAALREDPDVIVVGEMRDVETVRLAMTAAETGHLVVATMHTTNCVQTVDRLIKSFPPDEQAQVRMALSESLKYIVSQSLVPRKDDKGRVACFEVMKGTLSIGNLIRENKTLQLGNAIQLGRTHGMQSKDQALLELVEAGLISAETAWKRAEKPDTFEALCDPGFLAQKGVSA